MSHDLLHRKKAGQKQTDRQAMVLSSVRALPRSAALSVLPTPPLGSRTCR